LARRARRGDRAAFDSLVCRHKDELYRFVRRYVGQADDAYDVLQNCLVAAWLGLPRYDPARAFVPWLRKIALNKCRDFGRRQTVRRLFHRVFAEDQTSNQLLVHGEDAGNDAVRANDRLNRLDRAIADLPTLYKEPLLLTTVSGLSHEEVAVLLKTSSKAVEMRLYRARRKLRTALGEPEG
jgi:RNA polymerase sigma-70 factor (ECF subfamily)